MSLDCLLTKCMGMGRFSSVSYFLIFCDVVQFLCAGFLPEELDKFCGNYLYPSFTPTVFVFVAGTVVYGVYKYLQNEKIGGQE